MGFKKAFSGFIAAAMLCSSFAVAGSVTASAAAANVDAIDPSDFSSYTTYSGNDLGAVYTPEATTFKVWAPTSTDVKLKLYKTGSDSEEGAGLISTTQMTLDKSTGVWSVKVDGDIKNTYYTYEVKNSLNPDGIEVVDIYAKAAGVNGNRGMVVDLDSTDPAGWASDTHKLVESPTQAEVWEIHVKDFSYDPESGVSEQYRGKYMAFTEFETTLNNAGDVKTCMNYLKDLGVNYVQINPMYDYGSVNEASGDDTQFNWGYDPKNYNVPEGSYSTNAFDGNVRINEMKTMIKALHDNGIGVIMDVVYNHTYASQDSWFNLTVPNYYYRFQSSGAWSNGSGCGNDTASEREMFKKFMVDSVSYWADEYHIDGFRFDLMGLHDSDTMDAVREELDKIDKRIIMYGEGWTMGTTADRTNWKGNKTSLCIQAKAKRISDRIGFFNDDVRDAIKGKAFDDLTSPGYVSGNNGAAGTIYSSVIGHYTTSNWKVARPGQNVVYSCCHDNQTLWDRLVCSTYGSAAAPEIFDKRNERFVSGNKLAGAITMTAQGIPFILAGEEFSRTKYGDHNSYRSSPNINMLDWSRAAEYSDVVSYYKGLIELRNAFPGFADDTLDTAKAIEQLETPTNVVGFKVPNLKDTSGNTWSEMYVYYNGNLENSAAITLPAVSGEGSSFKGDVDNDGTITSSDALSILRASVNLEKFNAAKKATADIDGDDIITSFDALMVLRMSIDLEEKIAVGGEYSVLVNKQLAGVEELEVVSGTISVEPNSALVLVKKSDYNKANIGKTTDENTAYLVVNHINSATNKTIATTTTKGTVGQGYSTQPDDELALNYDFDKIEGAASGTLKKGTTTVNYYYKPYTAGVGTVVIKYVDATTGRALAETVTKSARVGLDYTSDVLGFPWYKLKAVPANAQGKFTADPIEVVYEYEPTEEVVTSTIHVKLDDGTAFTPYLHIWNYYYDGNKTQGTEWSGVDLTKAQAQKKGSGITINAVDSEGWYSVTFENGNGYNWILNDNAGSQTADMSSGGDIWVVAHGSAANVTVYTEKP